MGSSTTVIDDTLYAFGGRLLSRTKPQLTCDMYALDLITRVWVKLETRGETPRPRYFHSMCALGDTKLVCFGGMSPATSQQGGMGMGMNAPGSSAISPSVDSQNEVMVMSDIHIFDIPSRTWTFIPANNPPEGRYAHCATILPTSATLTSTNSVAAPVVGGLGLDGLGGAEMVIVGGQDSANHYIEEINVFNLRSLKWVSTRTLDRSCGAYRSVVAPLGRALTTTTIGAGMGPNRGSPSMEETVPLSTMNGGSLSQPIQNETNAMLVYSNYNFLDVKLELQIRLPDGSLTEKPMNGQFSPPGLRFPNGGVLDDHFVVSGTYLTSSKQEYALWALNLRTLIWSRIDAGQVFAQGSWNRGILWSKRNSFLILGNKNRSLVEDYNHRRINFTHVCMVELEAFGLYENPRMSCHPALQRSFTKSAVELGRMVLGMPEMSDMELVAIGGERIPINSRIAARRWGPYFIELLNAANRELPASPGGVNNNRPHMFMFVSPHSTAPESIPCTTANFNPLERPRTLFLPHTQATLLTLVHFLYTSTLPPPNHIQSTPQILCSLLQIARPYRIEGLLEAVVERLHQVLDGKNAAAVFNAAAMAAGGGAAIYGGLAAQRKSVDGMMINGDNMGDGEVWRGGVSSVIGLQKRGLRGLMEGRRIRERARSMGGGRQSESGVGQSTFGVSVN